MRAALRVHYRAAAALTDRSVKTRTKEAERPARSGSRLSIGKSLAAVLAPAQSAGPTLSGPAEPGPVHLVHVSLQARPAPKDWVVLWQLAWPAVLLNSLQTINSLLDGYFVEKLDPAALTAVGSATPVVFLFGSLTFMMGTAATALVSRFFGAQDTPLMREAARKALSLSFYVGILLAAVAIPCGPLFSALLVPAGNPEAGRLMAMYLGIFALALPALNLIQTLAGAMRGVGDTVSPMVLSGLQILLHICLNYLLIFPSHDLGFVVLPGAGWGLAGAGASLTISAWVAALLYALWAGRSRLGVGLSVALPGWEWTQRLLKIAVPSGMLSLLRVTSLMAFTAILARTPDGSTAVGAMRLGFSIESMAFMPAFGLAMAASALVGQSLGAGDPARAQRLGWLAGHHAAVISTTVSIFLILFAPQVAGTVASTHPEVAQEVSRYLYYICATQTFFAYAMVMVSAMQGAGDTLRPMWLTLVSMWLIRVPLAAALALPLGLAMGASGCWLSMSFTQTIQGILAMVMFQQGRWKSVRV